MGKLGDKDILGSRPTTVALKNQHGHDTELDKRDELQRGGPHTGSDGEGEGGGSDVRRGRWLRRTARARAAAPTARARAVAPTVRAGRGAGAAALCAQRACGGG